MGAEAVNFLASPMQLISRGLIFDRMMALRLPAIYQWPDMAEEGGLMGYGPGFLQVSRQRARQVVKILRGVKPTDLRVEQPSKFELWPSTSGTTEGTRPRDTGRTRVARRQGDRITMGDFRFWHLLRHAERAERCRVQIPRRELIAKAFGYDNWNILAAKINAAQPRAEVQKSAEHGNLLYCSFCGKNQHEVRKLVAGPAVYICDECIDLCTDIVDDQLLRLIKGNGQRSRDVLGQALLHYVEHAHSMVQRIRSALQRIEVLALRENAGAADDEELASASFVQLKNKTPDQLLVMQKLSQDQLKARYEQALRTATPIDNERTQ